MSDQAKPRDAKLLRGLQYFEAVARHGSISGAAREIGVSTSAVSHQMRHVTAAMGEDLLVKNGRGITLTNAGSRIAERLKAAFTDIDGIVAEAVGGSRPIVRLAVCSSFGPGWLAERLAGFKTRNPGVDIELRLYAQDPEQTDAVADAFVTALPVKPGYRSVPLFAEYLVPVRAAAAHATDRLPLITTDLEPDRLGADWRSYSERTGLTLDGIGTLTWIRCTHYLLAAALAKAGCGLALVPDFLVGNDIKRGALKLVDPTRVPSGRHYALCYKASRQSDASLKALARWLKAEAAS